jgi:hypothetical protein
MIASQRRRRSFEDMTLRELARIRLLNERFLEVEQWIHTCAAQYADASICVVADARVSCQSDTGNPDFQFSFDVPLARLDGRSRAGAADEQIDMNAIAPMLADMRASSLFLEAHRRLNGDWSAMLDSVRVHVDLSITLRHAFDTRV